jgi:hypothetical protein
VRANADWRKTLQMRLVYVLGDPTARDVVVTWKWPGVEPTWRVKLYVSMSIVGADYFRVAFVEADWSEEFLEARVESAAGNVVRATYRTVHMKPGRSLTLFWVVPV